MKKICLALAVGVAFRATAFAETIAPDAADTVVRNGEIIAASTVMQPEPSFMLLVRHGGRLFSCTVVIESTFSGDQMTTVKRCVDQNNNY